MTETFTIFFSGFMGACFGFAGLFFLKFWKASRDRFFLFFFFACELITIERFAGATIYGLYGPTETVPELRMGIYVIRLAAFTLLLIAIIQRNRASGIRS